MSYAIIKVGGKQYRVSEGEKLLVDRVRAEAGHTFTPDLLFTPDGDGSGVTVTARVVGHVKGDKIRIGKYRRRTGYRRHNGFRASLTQIEIQSIGSGKATPPKPKAEEPAPVEAVEAPVAAPAAVEAAAPEGLPEGYADLKVSEIAAASKDWQREAVVAALAYEREHANRKGALSALETALAKDEPAPATEEES